MTELLIARTNGVLRAPDGTQYRVVRGKTLAAATHPAAAAYPEAFMPVEIHLPGPDGAAHSAVEADTKVRELAEALDEQTAQTDALVEQLTRIGALLDERGLLDGVDRERPGWLADRLAELLAPPAPSTPARRTGTKTAKPPADAAQ